MTKDLKIVTKKKSISEESSSDDDDEYYTTDTSSSSEEEEPADIIKETLSKLFSGKSIKHKSKPKPTKKRPDMIDKDKLDLSVLKNLLPY